MPQDRDDAFVPTQVTPSLRLSVHDDERPERADAARNRRLLLQTAGRILREHGVSGLTMERVAAEAGVGIGTVYRRFGDRSGLANSLIDDEERRFQDAFMFGRPPLGPGAPPDERLRAFVAAGIDRLAGQAELIATAEEHPRRPQSAPYLLRRRHLIYLIEQIDPDADSLYLAEALVSLLSAKLYLHLTHADGMSHERVRAGIRRLVDGIIG